MNLSFSASDAQLILTFLSSIAVPFIVSYLRGALWSKQAKFALAVGVSVVAGFLTQYVAGFFDGETRSVVAVIFGVFTASQVHFASWFSGLGFDRALNPEQAFMDFGKDKYQP